MANIDKKISIPELSAANQESPVGAGRWFSWIRRWNGHKTYGKECGDNNRYVADAPKTDEIIESRRPSVECLAEKNLCTDWVLVEPKIRPPSPDHRSQQYAVVHGNYERMRRQLNIQRANVGWNTILSDQKSEPDRQTKCPDSEKLTTDTSIETVQNQQLKHDRVVEDLNNDKEKEIRTSTDLIDDKWKEEDNIFMKNELCVLKDNFSLMEQKLQNIDDKLLTQNLKLTNTLKKIHVFTEKVSICSVNRKIESDNMYEVMNNRIKKLVLIVDSLISERDKYINLIGDMTRQINSNKRKHNVNKKYFNKGKGHIKKDLANVKKHLYSLEMQVGTANKVVENNMKTQNIDRLKYDNLKMQLSLIEKAQVNSQRVINQMREEQIRQNRMVMSSAYLRGGVNDSMRNVHYEAKGQQLYSPSPVVTTIPLLPPAPPLPTVATELPVVNLESPVVLLAPPAPPLLVTAPELSVVDSESLVVPSEPSAPTLPVIVAELPQVDSESTVILPALPAPPLPVIVAESPVLDSELLVVPPALPERPLGIIDPEFPIVHLELQAPSTELTLEPPVEFPLLSIDAELSVVPPAVPAVLPLTLVVPEIPAVHNSP